MSLGLVHNTETFMEQNMPLEGRYRQTLVANGSDRQANRQRPEPTSEQQHSPLEDRFKQFSPIVISPLLVCDVVG